MLQCLFNRQQTLLLLLRNVQVYRLDAYKNLFNFGMYIYKSIKKSYVVWLWLGFLYLFSAAAVFFINVFLLSCYHITMIMTTMNAQKILLHLPVEPLVVSRSASWAFCT